MAQRSLFQEGTPDRWGTRPLPSLGHTDIPFIKYIPQRVPEGPVSYRPSYMTSANVHPGTGVPMKRFEYDISPSRLTYLNTCSQLLALLGEVMGPL